MLRPTVNAAIPLLGACALYANLFLLRHTQLPDLPSALYQENNLLENAQLLLLAACLVTLGWHYRRSVDRTARLILLAAALLSFTFLVRESDLRPFGLPAVFTWFSDGPGRYLLLTPPWLALLWTLRRHRRALHRRLRALLFSAVGAALACSFVLLVAGILLDKGIVRLVPSRYYEELFELDGYFFLLLAALASGARLRQHAA